MDSHQWDSPQLSIGSTLIQIFISNVDEGIKCTLSQFVFDTGFDRSVDLLGVGRLCRGVG